MPYYCVEYNKIETRLRHDEAQVPIYVEAAANRPRLADGGCKPAHRSGRETAGPLQALSRPDQASPHFSIRHRGAGKVFKGGLVVYSNQAKIELAKVSPIILQKYGAVSAKCAEEMARNTQKILGAGLAISFTGNAGPEGQEDKPVGLVYIGLVFKEKVISKTYRFSGSREETREKVVEEGMRLIRETLEKS